MSDKFIYTILMAQGIAIILLGIGIICLNITVINYGHKLEEIQKNVQKLETNTVLMLQSFDGMKNEKR